MRILPGEVFGNLTVLCQVERAGVFLCRWLCRCVCGTEKEVKASQLGVVRSCGCSRYGANRFVVGKRYGKLTAVRVTAVSNGHAKALFRCDCGGSIVTFVANAQRGSTSSCGCLRKFARRLPDGLAQLRYYHGRTKRNALRRGIPFDLTVEQVRAVVAQSCRYCGAGPKYVKTKTNATGFAMSGIDRRDNELGYTVTNSVPCCPACNVAKAKMNEAEFRAWIIAVHANYVTAKPA